jgi:hypothetical protein
MPVDIYIQNPHIGAKSLDYPAIYPTILDWSSGESNSSGLGLENINGFGSSLQSNPNY